MPDDPSLTPEFPLLPDTPVLALPDEEEFPLPVLVPVLVLLPEFPLLFEEFPLLADVLFPVLLFPVPDEELPELLPVFEGA